MLAAVRWADLASWSTRAASSSTVWRVRSAWSRRSRWALSASDSSPATSKGTTVNSSTTIGKVRLSERRCVVTAASVTVGTGGGGDTHGIVRQRAARWPQVGRPARGRAVTEGCAAARYRPR